MMHIRYYSLIFLLIFVLLTCDNILSQDVEAEPQVKEEYHPNHDTFEQPTVSSTSMPESTSTETTSNYTNDNKTTTTSDIHENLSDWEKNQRVQAQQEARRKRQQREREKDNLLSAKRTLQAAYDETCDWRIQPLAVVRGEVCGSYYKVLGLDRKRGIVDKSDIKKAYRQKSLNVHPDKNSSPEANEAFKVVQEAYECLSDDSCRKSYDRRLSEEEERITIFRDTMKRQMISKAMHGLSHIHYYLSVAAHHLYQTGLDLWDLAGEIEISMFGQPRPVGKVLMGLILAWKGRFLLKFHLLSFIIVKINYELAKSRGLL